MVLPKHKEKFLTEMAHMHRHDRLLMVGGDFNIMRSHLEKNKENFDNKWSFLFNAVIDGLNLREIEMSGRQYTWANNLSNPTFDKLDRILVTTEWELKYLLTIVQALNRDISNHTPLLLNRGRLHHHILSLCSNLN